tara:strand:+ start:1599 stop:1808 length:210 start_codon:yes stop_codon:yes gene_type:complete
LKHIREKRKKECQRIVGELLRLRHDHVLKAESAQIDHIYKRIWEMQYKGLLPELDIAAHYDRDTRDSTD